MNRCIKKEGKQWLGYELLPPVHYYDYANYRKNEKTTDSARRYYLDNTGV